MSSRSGLLGLEVEILRAVHRAAGAGTARTHDVLLALDEAGVVGARAALTTVADLLAPWRRHLPLLTGEGNWGSPVGDPPADPEHTGVGLSPYGELALAAEAGTTGPVPLGLVDGSWYRGGRRPPFPPLAVLAALRRRDGSDLHPRPPTGGTVTGDLDGLAAGRPVRLVVTATAEVVRSGRQPEHPRGAPADVPGLPGGWAVAAGRRVDPGGDRVVVTEVPYGITVDEVAEELTSRAHRERSGDPEPRRRHLAGATPRPPRAPGPVVDVVDRTDARHGVRVVCRVRPDADPEEARRWVLSTRRLRVGLDAALPAPLPALVTSWDAADGSGLAALGRLLDG